MTGTSVPLVRTSDAVTGTTYRSIGTLGKTTGTLVPTVGTDDRDSVPSIAVSAPLGTINPPLGAGSEAFDTGILKTVPVARYSYPENESIRNERSPTVRSNRMGKRQENFPTKQGQLIDLTLLGGAGFLVTVNFQFVVFGFGSADVFHHLDDFFWWCFGKGTNDSGHCEIQ